MKAGRLERIIVLAIGTGLALLIACGSSDDEVAGLAGSSSSSSSSGSPSASGGVDVGDGGATAPAKGVLLIHAAGVLPMRVCFSGYPDLPPQPDRKVLPQANVVGVDLGGVVRLGPMLTAPGDVTVILQRDVVSAPGKSETSCAKLLKTLTKDKYFRAGTISRPVGVKSAEAMVLTGCGPSVFFSQLGGITKADCGDYGLPETETGNLKMEVFALKTSNTTTETSMTTTVANLSPFLRDRTPAGSRLDVSFGAFAGADGGAPLDTPVPLDPNLYTEGPSTTLTTALTKEETFGRDGFRIAYREGDGGALTDPGTGGFVMDQSLAAIQANSRPDGNPTTYYAAQTNFAFFLLGDPRVQPTFGDGGANPNYDSRRAVHLLAVPVRDDSEAQPLGDAGASDASASDDAGDASVK